MQNNLIKIVCIADIHLGVLDVNDMWENLKTTFFSYCINNKPDIIVVAGDILDEQISVNSSTAAVFHMFIDELIKLNSTIIIIEGTHSHDSNQINMFSSKVNDKFRIYKKATVDYINDIKILMIPEEYMSDPDSYYKDFLSSKYDFCFGHGSFDNIIYSNGKKSTYRKLTSPMWNYDKHFKNIIDGRVIFGHVHTHVKNDKMYYVGSFGRYRHGEEEPKGFMSFTYDKVKKEVVSEEFIENKLAKIFRTVIESDLPSHRDELVTLLLKNVNESYRLRIKLNKKISNERKSDIISFCKDHLSTSIDSYYERKLKSRLAEDTVINDKLIENKYENMNIIDATVEFILEKHKIAFDRNTINKLINSGDDYD